MYIYEFGFSESIQRTNSNFFISLHVFSISGFSLRYRVTLRDFDVDCSYAYSQFFYIGMSFAISRGRINNKSFIP